MVARAVVLLMISPPALTLPPIFGSSTAHDRGHRLMSPPLGKRFLEARLIFDPSPALALHSERGRNRRVDFDRIAVEQRRFVEPLFHGVQGCLNQQRVTGD